MKSGVNTDDSACTSGKTVGPAGQMRHVRFALDTPVPIAKLDTQGLMFTKIPIGDQTLHIPWLPKPGGTR